MHVRDCAISSAVMRVAVAVACLLVPAALSVAQKTTSTGLIPPKTWDARELSDWATPLAGLGVRPGHFSPEEYYRAPVENYRTYPVYHPDREPPGYWEALKKKKPEPLVDVSRIGAGFDWIAAGKRVWEQLDVPFFRLFDAETISMARSPKYFRDNESRIHVTPVGTLTIYRWVVTPKGIGLSVTACSSCHVRYLEDGTAVAGAGFSFRTADTLLDRMLDRLLAVSYAGDKPQMALYRQFGVPWIRDDVHQKLRTIRDEEITRLFEAQIPGVSDRVNGSPYYITKVPDLIGIRDRKYIDHTATHQHRGPGDLMRYAALVEYSDAMDFGSHRMLSDAQRVVRVRWPDEVLYALAQYIYSLQPPPNPNRFDALAEKGRSVFGRAACATCHTPPLYTNNKLTLAEGFQPGNDHPLRADIMPLSIGTDANLALRTRKGTGLYKVPSLKGVWYRGLYGHDGAVTSLDEWLSPARLREDYVPTGFKGYGVKTRAIKGHEFGLKISPEDRRALVAFLKTL
jgi:hypothetical protein